MSATVLPRFKGYTVDLQQQKFRRAISGKRPENIDFLSRKGWKLFWELASFAQEVVEFYDYK
jgi:hypothetical protein